MRDERSIELMIAAHQPADGKEIVDRQAILDLLRTSAAPYSRSQFVPGHITASCFVIDSSRLLLLHHHRRLDRWLQMGGHLEAGEGPLEAALREAAEESGLRDLRLAFDGIADLDVHVIPQGRGDPEHRHFDVRYIARTASPEAIAIETKESRELMWFDLDRAATLMNSPESQRVIEKIRRLA